jgi:hypothetical protein
LNYLCTNSPYSAELVRDSEELQKAASETEAIERVVHLARNSVGVDNSDHRGDDLLLSKVPGVPLSSFNYTGNPDVTESVCTVTLDKSATVESSRLHEACLLAIASLASLHEPNRKQVIESGVLPLVVKGLSNTLVGIRSASCECTRSISRSVKSLRSALLDAGVGLPLYDVCIFTRNA